MTDGYDRGNPVMMTASYLRGSVEAAATLGGDLEAALASSGFSRDQLSHGEELVPLHSVVAFLNQAADELSCDTFGLAIAEHQSDPSLSTIGRLVRFAATLGDAIESALRFNVLNSEYSDWRLTRSDGFAALERYTHVRYNQPLVQMQLLSVGVVHRTLQAVLQRRVDVHQVCFAHAAPRHPEQVEAFFGAPVLFDATFSGLVFAESELERPIPTADDAVHTLLCEHLQTLAESRSQDLDTVDRLRHALRREIGSRHCTLDSVSRRWGIHPRRLQRSLEAKGTTFRAVLGAVRQDLAQDYLRDSSIAVVELADLLGYRNASAFSRAFKKQVGLSPEHWRRAVGSGASVTK